LDIESKIYFAYLPINRMMQQQLDAFAYQLNSTFRHKIPSL
jgi:hypothetical protein